MNAYNASISHGKDSIQHHTTVDNVLFCIIKYISHAHKLAVSGRTRRLVRSLTANCCCSQVALANLKFDRDHSDVYVHHLS